MKVYQNGTNVVVDLENANIEKKYIPIHNSKFLFVSGTLKILDATDDDEIVYQSTIANVKDESGSTFPNQDELQQYLSKFIGSPNLAQKNAVTHHELTNPSNQIFSGFKSLSFACDGSIDVTINSVTINYPKTFGGVKILGEDLKADLSSDNNVTFNGTGSVLIVQQK